MKTIQLTEAEITVLKLILRLDLDAIGVERKDQQTLASVLRKLRAVS